MVCIDNEFQRNEHMKLLLNLISLFLFKEEEEKGQKGREGQEKERLKE